jgi:hypothetical protein
VSDDMRGRLSRWSQRKLAARNGGALPDDNASAPEQNAVAPGKPEETEAPVLPPIESLTAESDYTAFLGKNVPEALKRAALRKLWTSDPVLANLDGLNDYDEDFGLVENIVAATQSSYQVGRGYADKLEKLVTDEGEADGPAATAESAAESRDDVAKPDIPGLSKSVAPADNSADAMQQSDAIDASDDDGRAQRGAQKNPDKLVS